MIWLASVAIWAGTYLAAMLIGYLIGVVQSFDQGFKAGADARHLLPRDTPEGGDRGHGQ